MPRRLLTAIAAGIAFTTGCTVELTVDDPDRPAPSPEVNEVEVRTPEQARRALADLPLTERARRDDYESDAFGSPWTDTDGNGCNQRDDVLLRDAIPGTVKLARQGSCDHDVLAGSWVDPYTGKQLTFTDLKDPAQAQAIQIDHVVPLAEAWASGASTWTDERRRAFANDLPGLLAVDGPTNARKSDDDPAAWRPRKRFQCEYAVRWVATKARWELTVDDSERNALADMLRDADGCRGEG